MIENTVPPAVPPAPVQPGIDPLESQGCLSELGYVFAGLALPAVSLGFYRLAARRKTLLAILIFFLIGVISTVLITLSVGGGLYSGVDEIRTAYASGSLPVITIQDGIATVDGRQPVVFGSEDSPTFLGVDTTGQITEIDTTRYASGVLITRTEVHLFNRGSQYQRFPLSTLNEMFQTNPLVIDEESVSRFWSGFATLFSILILFFVFLWTTVIRLGYIALLALPIWGLASLIKPNTSFNTAFITGLLASIPALYMVYLLNQVGVSFLFLGTLVELVFWLVFLVLVLTQQNRPLPGWAQLKPWRALIALPALGFFALNLLFDFPNGALISWILALVTLVVLAAVGLLTGPSANKNTIQPG